MRWILGLAAIVLAGGGKPDDKPDDKTRAAVAIDRDRLGLQTDGVTVLASRQNMVDTLVADDQALYWIARGGLENTSAKDRVGPSGVFRLATGGSPVRLGDSGTAAALVQDASDLFLGDPEAGTITRLPKAGGAAEVLVTGIDQLGGVAVDDTSLYYLGGAIVEITPAPSSGGIARASLTASKGDSLWRVPKHGPAKPTQVAAELGLASRLSLDGEHLYFAKSMEGAIARVPRRGGAVELVVKDPAIFPTWIVAHGTVYYERRRATAGDLVRVVAGGSPEVMLETKSPPGGSLTVAGDTLYAATDDGSLHEVSPKGARILRKRNLAPAAMVVRGRTLVIAEVTRVIEVPLGAP